LDEPVIEQKDEPPVNSESETEPAFTMQEPVTMERAVQTESERVNDRSVVNGKPRLQPEPALQPEDLALQHDFENLLKAQNIASGSFVIICANTKLRRKMLAALSNDDFRVKENKNGNSIEHAKVQLSGERTMELFGFSTEGKYLGALQQLPGLTGYIVLIQGHETSRFGYLSYLLDHLRNKLSVSGLLAINRDAGQNAPPLEVIRYTLNTASDAIISEVSVSEPESLRNLLKKLTPKATLSGEAQ